MMSLLFRQIVLILSLMVLVSGCNSDTKEEVKPQKEMLFYIGITMVRPVNELAKNFEKAHAADNLKITIIQGGSQDLYNSVKQSGKGDLYLPGSNSYRKNNIKDGHLLNAQFVGYNKAAIVVKKGNPLDIKSDLKMFVSSKYRTILCNPESGSIGKMTKRILSDFGNYKEAVAKAVFLSTDSRNMNKAIINGDADVCINWHATTFWDDNKEHLQAIPIDERYAKKKMLVFSLLKSSKYPELAKKFMEYASSEEGRSVFYKYGFLDDEDIKNFDKVIVE